MAYRRSIEEGEEDDFDAYDDDGGDNFNLLEEAQGDNFGVLQENIFNSVYHNLLLIASHACSWIPFPGELENPLELPDPELDELEPRTELSTYGATLAINAHALIEIMFDKGLWRRCFSRILFQALTFEDPPGLLNNLSADRTIMVAAEFHVPTLEVTERMRFLRCLTKINEGLWAVVDGASDYYPGVPVQYEDFCWRKKPSGVFIKSLDDSNCEIFWVEHLRLPRWQPEVAANSDVLNSEIAYGARRWVNSLTWWLNRCLQKVTTTTIDLNEIAVERIMNEAWKMQLRFYTFDHGNFLHEIAGIKIYRHNIEVDRYVAVSIFRVPADPVAVSDSLLQFNLRLQWPVIEDYTTSFEEVFSCSSGSRNSVLFSKRVATRTVLVNKASEVKVKRDDYLLHEISHDGICSFVIGSDPVSLTDFKLLQDHGRLMDACLHPSGFSVFPYEHGSIVTHVFRRLLHGYEEAEASEFLVSSVRPIIQEILSHGHTS